MTLTPDGTPRLTSSGALARLMRTVGAAHRSVMRSSRTSSNTRRGSIFGRQTWTPPAAVTVQVNVQPLA